jgi:hypothetical protein
VLQLFILSADKKSKPNESKAVLLAPAVLVSRVFGVKGLAGIIMGFGDLRDNARFAEMTPAAREASKLLVTVAYRNVLLERCKAVQWIDLQKFAAKLNAEVDKKYEFLDRDALDWHWDICKHCEVKTIHQAANVTRSCQIDSARHDECRAASIRNCIPMLGNRMNDTEERRGHRYKQYNLWLLHDIWRACFDVDWTWRDVPDWLVT